MYRFVCRYTKNNQNFKIMNFINWMETMKFELQYSRYYLAWVTLFMIALKTYWIGTEKTWGAGGFERSQSLTTSSDAFCNEMEKHIFLTFPLETFLPIVFCGDSVLNATNSRSSETSKWNNGTAGQGCAVV